MEVKDARFKDGSLISDALDEGIRLFNEREFFDCHEVLEDAWREEHGPLRDLYQGLIKAAVAFYHAERQNFEGATKVMRSGLPQLRPYIGWHGLDMASLVLQCEDWLGTFIELEQTGGQMDSSKLPFLKKVPSGDLMADQGFRIGVYGVIVQGDHILLVELEHPKGNYFHLPGGGVEPGESLQEALHREIQEEVCAQVNIGRLLVIWEYDPIEINPRHDHQHLLELVFECELISGNEPQHPENPDPRHVDVKWVPLKDFAQTRLLPNINQQILDRLKHTNDNPYVLEQS